MSHSLDLDAWINEPPSDSESEDEKPKAIFHEEEPRPAKPRQLEADEEELARVSSGCTEAGFIPAGAPGAGGTARSTLKPKPTGGCASPGRAGVGPVVLQGAASDPLKSGLGFGLGNEKRLLLSP